MHSPVSPSAVSAKGKLQKSKWGKLRTVASCPSGFKNATATRISPSTPRWKGHGLAGILDAACNATHKPVRRHRAMTADSVGNVSCASASSFVSGDDSQPSGSKGAAQLTKKLENHCHRQMQKLLHLESDSELNVLESNGLRQRAQELQKQNKEEHQRCKELAEKGKKADQRLRLLLNDQANVKLDAHLNKKGWNGEMQRRNEELKQLVQAATVPQSGPDMNTEPRGRDTSKLVAKVRNLRRANDVCPQSREFVGELKGRCHSATSVLAEVVVRERALSETIARNDISTSLLERDLSCAGSCLTGMHEAASKDASQFAHAGREKALLEHDLEEARRVEALNHQQAKQIKAEALSARKEARDKLYLGELEVRRLESVLRQTKDKTAEHMAEAELLAQWETRLPVAHLNQYKVADDNFYKIAERHHALNKQLREALEYKKAEFEARASSRHMVATAQFGTA